MNLATNLFPIREQIAVLFGKHRHITMSALIACLVGLDRKCVAKHISTVLETGESHELVRAGGRKRKCTGSTDETGDFCFGDVVA